MKPISYIAFLVTFVLLFSAIYFTFFEAKNLSHFEIKTSETNIEKNVVFPSVFVVKY